MKVVFSKVLLPVFMVYAVIAAYFGRFTFPSMSEYVKAAQQRIWIVQAISDYKSDHGTLPETFADLVPKYLKRLPSDPDVEWTGICLNVRVPVPHTGLFYSFEPEREGWWSAGDFSKGRLPLPIVHSLKKPPASSSSWKHSMPAGPLSSIIRLS